MSILDLPSMPDTANPVVLPALLSGLGITKPSVDADFRASIDGGFTESFEDYCTRISRTEEAT